MRQVSRSSSPIFKLIKISGQSMSPTLEDGDYVLTIKPRSIRPGLIYVINHSDLGRIVKRCSGQDGDRYTFSGDNPASSDSIIGRVDPARIVGRALLRIHQGRIRSISRRRPMS